MGKRSGAASSGHVGHGRVSGRRDGSWSLRTGSAWTLAGTLAQGGFRFLLNILIGRFGGASLLGQTSGILAIAQLATLFGATSLSAALTRYTASAASDASTISALAVVRHLRMRMAQWLTLMLVAVAGIVAATGALSRSDAVIAFILASGLAGYQFAKAHLLGAGEIRKASLLELTTAVAGMVLAIGLLWAGVRDENLLWPVAATAVTFLLASGLPRGKGKPRPEVVRELDHYALLGVAGTLVSAGFLQGSMILASVGLDSQGAGEYASAFTLATPLSLLTMSVGLILFPAFSRVHQQSLAFKALLLRASSGMAVLLVPGFSLIMALSPEVTRLAWGEGVREADQVLPLLVCAVMFAGLGMPASQALTSTGVPGMATSVKIGACGLLTGTLIWAVAVPAYGAWGVGLGYLAGTLITSATPLIITAHSIGARWVPHLLRGWGTGLVVCAASVAAAHSSVDTAKRAGVALVIFGLWLIVSRREVMALAHR